MTNSPPFRRVAIIGAGAMGASLAALISADVPTVLVVRDATRADRIRRFGIRLSGKLQAEGRPDVVDSIASLAGISPIDLVVIATKTTAIADVCRSLKPHLRELPFIVSYQNGIEPGRTIIARLGTPRVVRMVLTYGASLVEPEVRSEPLGVRVDLHAAPHWVGGEGEAAESVSLEIARWLTRLGLPTEVAVNIDREAWRKGIANAAGNVVAALTGVPLGELLKLPARALIELLIHEGVRVASAAGVDVGEGYAERTLDAMAAGGSHLPSMAQDVMKGRETELTQLNEQIVIRGRALGVPTPTHEAMIALIRTFEAYSDSTPPGSVSRRTREIKTS